jgi:hypothetical protein
MSWLLLRTRSLGLKTLDETHTDDACFTAAELIDVRPAQPISADKKVFECGIPRFASQLF